MKRKLIWGIAPLLLVSLIISGCNIFSWTSGESTESLIDEGIQCMHDLDYSGAVDKFAEAMENNPLDSDARYYHAKATMRASGFNPLQMTIDVSDNDLSDGEGLVFTGDDITKIKANKLFQAVKTVYVDLKPIYDGTTTSGDIDANDIDLDMGVATFVKAILFFRDTNCDGIIDEHDFDLFFMFDNTLDGFSITNLDAFAASGSGSGKLGSGTSAAPQPIDPDLIVAFNNMIDNIIPIINESLEIILAVIEDLDPDLDIDPEDIEEVINMIDDIAQRYKIADGYDNDDDGSIDEETINGIDDDGDGWIDEDSNGYYDFSG